LTNNQSDLDTYLLGCRKLFDKVTKKIGEEYNSNFEFNYSTNEPFEFDDLEFLLFELTRYFSKIHVNISNTPEPFNEADIVTLISTAVRITNLMHKLEKIQEIETKEKFNEN
jgi:hypothetical protein